MAYSHQLIGQLVHIGVWVGVCEGGGEGSGAVLLSRGCDVVDCEVVSDHCHLL